MTTYQVGPVTRCTGTSLKSQEFIKDDHPRRVLKSNKAIQVVSDSHGTIKDDHSRCQRTKTEPRLIISVNCLGAILTERSTLTYARYFRTDFCFIIGTELCVM